MRFGVRDENRDSECQVGGRGDEKGPCVRRESIVVKLKNHGVQRGEYNVRVT